MVRRMLVLTVMALMLTCLVSGLSWGAEGSATEKDPVHLVIRSWGEEDFPGLQDWLRNSIEEYAKIKPYVKVEGIMQGVDEVIPAFQAAVAVQEGPDIATLWYGGYWFPEIWAGNVEPLNQYISEEEYKHWIGLETVTWDGKIWGVPMYTYTHVGGYNKELFRKAGLDAEHSPGTWAEFLDACEKLKEAGITPIKAGLKDGWFVNTFNSYFMTQMANAQDILEAVVGKRSFTDEKFLDVWERLEELKIRGYFNDDMGSLDYYGGNQAWLAGENAFNIGTSADLITAMKRDGSENIGVFMYPALEGDEYEGLAVMTMSNFVTPWSPNKQEAADFLVYLHTPDRSETLYSLSKSGPQPADDRFDISSIQEPSIRKVFQYSINGYEKKTWVVDGLVPWGILGEGMIPAMQLMWAEDLSAKEAAEMTERSAATWRKLSPESVKDSEMWAEELAGS